MNNYSEKVKNRPKNVNEGHQNVIQSTWYKDVLYSGISCVNAINGVDAFARKYGLVEQLFRLKLEIGLALLPVPERQTL